METRRDKAAADARFEANAEWRERQAEEKAERLLARTIADGCPCDLERRLDPDCCALGECARATA